MFITVNRLWQMAVAGLMVFPTLAAAAFVDYTVPVPFTTNAPLTIGGLTATAGGGQSLGLDSFGLGVVGGSDALGYSIDTNESVLFEFTGGLAAGVSLIENFAFNGGNQDLNLEGLGVGMASLGVVQFNIFAGFPNLNVSAAFGDVPLSGFRIFGNGTGSGIDIASVSFTPVVTSVPELDATAGTSAIALLAGALILVGERRGQVIRAVK